jgi:hypothetical protein
MRTVDVGGIDAAVGSGAGNGEIRDSALPRRGGRGEEGPGRQAGGEPAEESDPPDTM